MGKIELPNMDKYLRPLKNPGQRQIVGREDIIKLVAATLNRNEISNVALLGEAGTGKTTVAYAAAQQDTSRSYYEVRLSLMTASEDGSDGSVQMASRLTSLIDEVMRYQRKTGKQLVLFMDEFHLIMEISPAAVEALKPILANSGSRGVKLIVATTYDEYRQYIRPNEALNERLERVSLPELSTDETIAALHNMLETYEPDELVDSRLLHQIVETTNRVIPSQKQPRKSLRILDAMIGWHKTFGDPIDRALLAKIVKASIGADIDYQVDIDRVESYLNSRVFDQQLAVYSVADRILVSVASLNDRDRPRGSFLFTGSTGVGKTELAKSMAKMLLGSEDKMIRFDMEEFSDPLSAKLLKNLLTEAVLEHPSSVVLLDEIEKAAPECSKILLQVLDDARMTDENAREVSFRDTYIILTTNVGYKVFDDIQADFGHVTATSATKVDDTKQDEMLRAYLPLIRKALQAKGSKFPPELLGRFDRIVPFAPIDAPTRNKICHVQLDKITAEVQLHHGVTLHIKPDVYRFITLEHIGSNSASSGGGREVYHRIDEYITPKVARAVLKYPQLTDLAIVVNGTMALDLANDVKGNATIGVERWQGDF